MSDIGRDPVLTRAIDELRRLPEVDAGAVREVVAAAARMRVSPSDDDAPAAPRGWLLGWRALALAEAAAILGVWIAGRGAPAAPGSGAPAAAAAAPAAPVAPALPVDERGVLPIPRQFIFNDANARRVSVVGDFNQWDAHRAPMTRSPDGELWAVTIPILPGRHLYGFMVDDSLFVLDPRAPAGRDPDLGAPSSVVIVGRP